MSKFAAAPATTTPAVSRPRRRTRRWCWLLLALAGMVSLAAYPPPWRGALRALLSWQASRQGCDLQIDAIEGGPFDSFDLYGVHCRQRDLGEGLLAPGNVGTDLRVAHASITFGWAAPAPGRTTPTWVRQLTAEGVRGRWDLTPGKQHHAVLPPVARLARMDELASRLVPAEFFVRLDGATLRRGRYSVRGRALTFSGRREGQGLFAAAELEAAGPNFDANLPDQHGRTFWQGDRITLSGLDLGGGVRLVRAAIDGGHLARRRLDWECDVRALGGSMRGQGAINFSRERLALEVGGSVQRVALGPLARLLDVTGPADGQIEQASFSFRGDPENWPAADLWLAGRATDFRWGARRWESLDVQAVVTNRRVAIHRLELRQSRNRLSLDGECSLPPDPLADAAAGAAGRWWQAGFACNVDARLEDLHELAQLLGPPAPDIAGRMSINGRLGARAGTQGFDGYLNVEGSALAIRGAPLDYLRSTVLFHGEVVDVADLQATRAGDYLSGHGSMRIVGSPDFQASGRVSIDDLGVYTPAYADLLPWARDIGAPPVRTFHAEARLEGSTLHIDRCTGDQAGNTFGLGGSVNLAGPAGPVLDLSLTGEEPARMSDPADAGAAWRAGVAYALALSGPAAGGATIRGDVQLLHGHFDRSLDLGAGVAPAPPDAAALLEPLSRRLPAACREWPLDLRVTAAEPLASGDASEHAEMTPDLQITGTAMDPRLRGKLGLEWSTGTAQASGAWYFLSARQPDDPTLSITLTADRGQRGTFFYGPLSRREAISWSSGAPESPFALRASQLPPTWIADAGSWADWLPALVPGSEGVWGHLP